MRKIISMWDFFKKTVFSTYASAKKWICSHRREITQFFGILLIAALSFEAGMLTKLTRPTNPLVISLPKEETQTAPQFLTDPKQVLETGGATIRPTQSQSAGTCVFVGSRNSNLYHLPSCAPAKRIKPENKVCFTSKEDAETRGYKPGCLK